MEKSVGIEFNLTLCERKRVLKYFQSKIHLIEKMHFLRWKAQLPLSYCSSYPVALVKTLVKKLALKIYGAKLCTLGLCSLPKRSRIRRKIVAKSRNLAKEKIMLLQNEKSSLYCPLKN